MINPLRIKALVNDMQLQIETINKSDIVVDDSQLTKFLQEWKINENFFLIGIIPEYPVVGDQDRIKIKNQMMFMILKKTAASITPHAELMKILDDTLVAAKEFVTILLSERTGDNGDFCGLANELVENSISIYPIWNKAQCNGWGINLDLLSDF